jgi:hypothetical protein
MSLVTPEMIKWGVYQAYEGPWWPGHHQYVLPINPDFWDKTLAVLSSTEGPLDCVNMYDSCVCSTSMVQLCDASYFLTTSLLGYIADNIGPTAVTGPLSEALKSSGATFKKVENVWRFQFLDKRGRIVNSNMQRELYLKGTGLRNSWSADQKRHAKLWCAGMANIWNDEKARNLQIKYLKTKLPTFISPSAKKDIFDQSITVTTWVEVARAAFTSYSANNPSKAATAYFKHCSDPALTKWSKEWVICLIRELTFNPKITIYEGRYNHIRPVLEKLWGVGLPQDAIALKNYDSKVDVIIDNPLETSIAVDSVLQPILSIPPASVLINDQQSFFSTVLSILLKFLSFFGLRRS